MQYGFPYWQREIDECWRTEVLKQQKPSSFNTSLGRSINGKRGHCTACSDMDAKDENVFQNASSTVGVLGCQSSAINCHTGVEAGSVARVASEDASEIGTSDDIGLIDKKTLHVIKNCINVDVSDQILLSSLTRQESDKVDLRDPSAWRAQAQTMLQEASKNRQSAEKRDFDADYELLQISGSAFLGDVSLIEIEQLSLQREFQSFAALMEDSIYEFAVPHVCGPVLSVDCGKNLKLGNSRDNGKK